MIREAKEFADEDKKVNELKLLNWEVAWKLNRLDWWVYQWNQKGASFANDDPSYLIVNDRNKMYEDKYKNMRQGYVNWN